MFEKNMRIAYLLDFYEDLLDPHVRNVMRAYYDDDLSLSEVASGEGISRQGIRHLIKKGEESLEFFEKNLGLAKRHEELIEACDSLARVCSDLEKDETKASSVADIKQVIDVIMKGNQDVPKFN